MTPLEGFLLFLALASALCFVTLIVKGMKSRSGHLVAQGQGEADILLPFAPAEVEVGFDDDQPVQPSCANLPPDSCGFVLSKSPQGFWVVSISWQVQSTRTIVWHASKDH